MRYRVLKFLLTSAKKWPKTGEKSIFMKNGKNFIIHIEYEETDPTISLVAVGFCPKKNIVKLNFLY